MSSGQLFLFVFLFYYIYIYKYDLLIPYPELTDPGLMMPRRVLRRGVTNSAREVLIGLYHVLVSVI